jgi:hypothetical protein
MLVTRAQRARRQGRLQIGVVFPVEALGELAQRIEIGG